MHNRKRKHESPEIEYNVPKSKFRPLTETEQQEEEQLNKILFGGTSTFLQSLEEAEQESPQTVIDSGVGEDDSSDSNEQIRKPAWFDEEDDGIEVGHALDVQGRKLPSGGINSRSNKYSRLLTNKFTSLVGTPSWASLDKNKVVDNSSDDDEDDKILRTCGFIAKTSKENLPSSLLEFKKVKDLNCESYNEGPIISCVEFHPTSSVALVAGSAGIASLYAVDGKRNNKLHSIAFERYPIYCGKFIENGNEAILGSRYSHIFTYDLIKAKHNRIKLPSGLTQCKKFVISPDSKLFSIIGKWGEVHLMTTASKERIGLLKQDSELTALEYNPNGNLLYGHSDIGEITIWDMKMRRVLHKFQDDGCLQGTTLSISSNNQFLASGSAQGVVNLYEIDKLCKTKLPKPRKTIMNLTTGITDLKFNSTSELLSLSSIDIKNSMKLFHVGSGSVFSNFPLFGTKLGNVNVVNFSPNNGFMAIANRKNTVALYRLKHYRNY